MSLNNTTSCILHLENSRSLEQQQIHKLSIQITHFCWTTSEAKSQLPRLQSACFLMTYFHVSTGQLVEHWLLLVCDVEVAEWIIQTLGYTVLAEEMRFLHLKLFNLRGVYLIISVLLLFSLSTVIKFHKTVMSMLK